MAVTLTGTSSGNQGLFNRLGAIGHLIDLVNAFRGGANSGNLPPEVEDALELADGANTTIRDAVDELLPALSQVQAGMEVLPAACRTVAQQVLVEMFDADSPLPADTVAEALIALGRQMRTATTTYVDANSVSATVTSTGNDGNGNIVTSVKNGEGFNLENLLAETLWITVIDTDTAGEEVLNVRGGEEVQDRLSHLYPGGSGSDQDYTAVNAAGSDNLVTNGAFDDFTANAPDSWTIAVGAAGAEIFEEASVVYVAGGSALKLEGGTAELTQIYQALEGLEAKKPYAINFWAKVNTPPAAGALVVDLHDGSNVIADDAGTNNSATFDVTAMTTSYVAKSLVVRLPEPVPATVRLRLRLSTAISGGTSLYIDHLAMAEMEQTNPDLPGASPFVCAFSGSSNWTLDDGTFGARVFKIVTANDNASLWQRMFVRLFETDLTGYILPTSGSTLINDNLIG